MASESETSVPSSGWIAFFSLLEAILDRFGWPGALLIYVIYFIEKNATRDQKGTIIDLYLLGKGINLQYPVIILGGVFILAFLAQWMYYDKKFRLMKEEVRRLGVWKTRHQEQQVGGPLHHSGDAEE